MGGMRSSTTLLITLTLMLGGSSSVAVGDTPSAAGAGAVKFVKQADTSFNSFTEAPTAEFEAWMNQHFWRAEVFSPYFDDKTGWYRHGWDYKDLYALYTGSAYAASHEDWILRGPSGNPMYIPYGCANGSCPEYAADVGNVEFRHAWIAAAKQEIEKGYIGLWIDDVNLEFRVGNAAGEQEAPIDPRTGQPMHGRNTWSPSSKKSARRCPPPRSSTTRSGSPAVQHDGRIRWSNARSPQPTTSTSSAASTTPA
jgi:hypothetical protein